MSAFFHSYIHFSITRITSVNPCTDFADKKNLSLYGLPNRSWELKVPNEHDHLITNVPVPTIGINFARPDNLLDTPWIPFLAKNSDSWLLAVAFYYATRSGFDLADR